MKDILSGLAKKTEETEFYDSMPEGYTPGKTKYIIVTGSVISGVGKGTFSSCLGALLKLFHSLNVVPIKFECYLNYDAGTLNPFRHGEVFVLNDGTESDLDLGTYERLLNTDLTGNSFVTVGKVFKTIIDKERAGRFLGRDVEFIPHVTGEIKNFLRKLSMKSEADIIMVEIGGTVGDIESLPFLEAIRQMRVELGSENTMFIHLTLVPFIPSSGEIKTKPTQHSVKEMRSIGIQPDMLICRSHNPITEAEREKIALFTNVEKNAVVSLPDMDSIYKVP